MTSTNSALTICCGRRFRIGFFSLPGVFALPTMNLFFIGIDTRYCFAVGNHVEDGGERQWRLRLDADVRRPIDDDETLRLAIFR